MLTFKYRAKYSFVNKHWYNLLYFANFFFAQCCHLWKFYLHEEGLENFCSLVSFCEDLFITEHVLSSYILLNFLDGTSYTNKNATIHCTWDKVLFGLARKKSLLSILLVPTMRRKEKVNQVANWRILPCVIWVSWKRSPWSKLRSLPPSLQLSQERSADKEDHWCSCLTIRTIWIRSFRLISQTNRGFYLV